MIKTTYPRNDEAFSQHEKVMVSIDTKRGTRLLVALFLVLSSLNIIIFVLFAFANQGKLIQDYSSSKADAVGYQISSLYYKDPEHFHTLLKKSDISNYRVLTANGELIYHKPETNNLPPKEWELSMLVKAISSKMIALRNFVITLNPESTEVVIIQPLSNQQEGIDQIIFSTLPLTNLEENYQYLWNQVLFVSAIFIFINILFLTFSYMILVRPLRQANQVLNNQSKMLQIQKDEIQYLYNETEENLDLGWKIQLSMFPDFKAIELKEPSSSIKTIISSFCQPMEKVSGDFVDWVELEDRSIVFILVDVVGHGVASALITTMVKLGFRNALHSNTDPGDILTRMNFGLYEHLNHQHSIQNSYLTAFVGKIQPGKKEFYWSNAGHTSTFYITLSTNQLNLLKSNGPMIAILPKFTFKTERISIKDTTRIIVYSDGVSETKNPEGKLFGNQMTSAILEMNQQPGDQVIPSILNQVNVFRGDSPVTDDLSIIVADVLM